jgi:hypothetical protein
MKTKREQVIQLLEAGEYKEAMKIAKDFVRDFPKQDAKIIARAYEMTWNPKFYEALGFKAEVEFEKAKDILIKTYL